MSFPVVVERARLAPVLMVLALCLGATPIHAQEDVPMQVLTVVLDGRPVSLTPGPRINDKGEALVPLHAFADLVGAEAKNGPLAVCKGDLCIPLNSDTVSVEGTVYAPLPAFGEPLGLSWRVEGDTLRVTTSENGAQTGLGIGQRPPGFTLPDLYTGEPVSLADYRGKKTVFYMWASW